MTLLDEHLGYVADGLRTTLMRRAIGQAVSPGHRVLDLGCGSGLLGLLALQAGASRVCAVDETAIAELARETLHRAGFADRATIVRSSSQHFAPSERFDVVLCDHVGYFGFDYGILELLADARHRFLEPGGILIPSRVDLFVALVDAPGQRQLVHAWSRAPVPSEYRWVDEMAAQGKYAVRLKPSELVSQTSRLCSLELGHEHGDFLSWTTTTIAHADGTVDGVAGWFTARLFGDVWMTNAPHPGPDVIDRPQALLPFARPMSVARGDRVDLTIMARPRDHIISWRASNRRTGEEHTCSTLQSLLLGTDDVRQRDPDHTPRLSARAMGRRMVMDLCDGTRSVSDITRRIESEHPEIVPPGQSVAEFVRSVLATSTE